MAENLAEALAGTPRPARIESLRQELHTTGRTDRDLHGSWGIGTLCYPLTGRCFLR